MFAKLKIAITNLHDLVPVTSDLVVGMKSGKAVYARMGILE